MTVTRFAPSPTGDPHIGNIRTALFSWLFARSQNGVFFVRIEDTDKSREVEGSVDMIMEPLKWLGLTHDKIPNSKFQNLIFQSTRLPVYKKYAEQLVKNGLAYICTCSEERLSKLREEQIARKEPTMYDGHCRDKAINKESSPASVIRLKVPKEGATEFADLIRGEVRFENKLIDDQVLLKSDGYPTYHLASVVDDNEMKVTHVIRGEDWLSSTPKHLLLYEYFGWAPPFFAHLPMILGSDKSKLSKRHGAMPVLEYKKGGYLADAVFNYLSLLGWHPEKDQEIMSREEIIAQFSLERVQKSAAVFDPKKLAWLNGVYLRRLSSDALVSELLEYGAMYDPETAKIVQGFPDKTRKSAIALVQERMQVLKDFERLALFLVELPAYNDELLSFKGMDKQAVRHSLSASKELIGAISEDEFTPDRLHHYFSHLIEQKGASKGEVLHPLRVALSGLRDSPGPFEIAAVLGKTETIRRLKRALQK